jgi:excisionase family DNA binding protein
MDTKKFENLSFNEMPQAIEYLINKVASLSDTLERLGTSKTPETDVWMTIDDVVLYLPDNPSKQTVYAWVCQKTIPCNKIGKRLYFLKSDIDEWLKNGRRKTAGEIAIEACAYFEKQNGK